jgi:frataxin-like iron-binding protein CyaY
MLYNMAFILDTLLNQVDVIDSYLGTILELNIPDYIELVLNKQTK